MRPHFSVFSCQLVLFIKQHFKFHPAISLYHRALQAADAAVGCVTVL